MAKKTQKREAKKEPVRKSLEAGAPTFPADFRGAQYGNQVTISASAQEVFLDLIQLGPEAGTRPEGTAIFVGRFIFPLTLAKTVVSELQSLVERIEKDTGIKLPEPEEG